MNKVKKGFSTEMYVIVKAIAEVGKGKNLCV